MFLVYYLKYLKPFKLRFTLAIFCMAVVSAFGAVNVLMMKFPLEILFQKQQGENHSQSGDGRNADGSRSGNEAVPNKEGFSLLNMIPKGVKDLWNGIGEGPREYWREKSAAFKDWYAEESSSHPLRVLLGLAGVLLATTFIKCVAEYLAEYHLAYSFYFINARMQEDIFRNILKQDYLYFVSNSPGFLISRITSDVGAIKQVMNKLLSDGIQQPMTLLACAAALVYISLPLTLIVALLLPPIGLLLYLFGRSLRKNTRKQKRKSDELSGSMTESLHNVRLVKAFGTEELEAMKFNRRIMELFRYEMNRRLAKFASGPIMEFVGAMAAGGVLVLGGMMVLGQGPAWAGPIGAIDFFLFLFLLTRFYRPLKSLAAAMMSYQLARVSSERLIEMMSLHPKVMESESPLPFTHLKEGIELKNVTLRYKEKTILDNISLKIPRGQTVALVGKTGAGKTSLANLLPRLFDPDEGAVLIDGADLKQYRLRDLRARMGIVTQETILFNDTIANNITYGSDDEGLAPEVRQARIVRAAEAAHADEFIPGLDGGLGYDTRVGIGGKKLSGGQAQRIAIARAIYRDPEILIFDEATSALDAASQALVQDAIANLLKDRTALVIAHRFSSIRHADAIGFLKDGELIEWGTHEELTAMKGHYDKLHHSDRHGRGVELESADDSHAAPEPVR